MNLIFLGLMLALASIWSISFGLHQLRERPGNVQAVAHRPTVEEQLRRSLGAQRRTIESLEKTANILRERLGEPPASPSIPIEWER